MVELRRVRQAVGFTNRSRPATAVSRSKDEIGHVVERPGTSSGHNERPRTGSSGSQRPSTRVQQRERHDLFAEHTGYSGVSTRGTMARPATADKPIQRRVREKILRHRLNLGPLLRPYADEAGCVAPEGMRNALAGAPQLALTNDELDFCTGPGGAGAESKIHVHNFLLSLDVPSYDDNYDPWGKLRAREMRLLRDRVSNLPTRTFSHKSFEVPETLGLVPPKPAGEDETAGVELGTQPSKPKHKPGAGIARKYLKQIGDQMEVKGLELLDIFRKIDIDSSGTIDQSEFEEAVHVIGVPGIEARHMAFLFRNIDENGNGKVDIHELKNALTEAQIDDSGGSQPSRPSTFRPDGTGSLSNEPWASRTNGTRIPSLLPADHFNIRFRRSLMPPYATSETVILRVSPNPLSPLILQNFPLLSTVPESLFSLGLAYLRQLQAESLKYILIHETPPPFFFSISTFLVLISPRPLNQRGL